MSTSIDRIPVPGSRRAWVLDLLHPVIFILAMLYLSGQYPGPWTLLVVLAPAAIISTLVIVTLRALLTGALSVKNGRFVKGVKAPFSSLLHLHASGEQFGEPEKVEESLELVFSNGKVFRSHAEEDSVCGPREDAPVLAVDSSEDEEVMVIEDDEEVVCGSANYQYVSPTTSSDLPQLDLRKNEIKVLKKKIDLPTLRLNKDITTPWSSIVPCEEPDASLLEFDLETPEISLKEDVELALPVELSLSQEPLLESEVPLIEPTPMVVEAQLELPESRENSLPQSGEPETDQSPSLEKCVECHPFDGDCEVVTQPGDYLAAWQADAPPSRDYSVCTDSSFLHNSNYALHSCDSCSVVFASSRDRPVCPSCKGVRCHKQ
jgi:hypothetical protein